MTPDEALQHRWVAEAAAAPTTYRGPAKRHDQHTPTTKPQHVPAYSMAKPAAQPTTAGADWASDQSAGQLLPSSYAAAQQWPQPQPMQVRATAECKCHATCRLIAHSSL
jgi:hypothetical protein